MVVPGAGGGGTGELLLNGDRVSVLHDEQVWRLAALQCEHTEHY